MARLCDPLDRLTPRRLQIVELAYDGFTDIDIAHMLRISPHTLRWHTTQIRQVLPTFRFPEPHLSGREREVAALVAAGRCNGAISRQLHLSRATVSRCLNALYTKTQTENRIDLACTVLIVQNRLPIGATEAV
jgi:DNA-binding NarL/FixJ family response regulator